MELLVDGERRAWPRGDGSLEEGPLTKFMYPALNPSSRPDYPPLTEDGGPVATTTTTTTTTIATTTTTAPPRTTTSTTAPRAESRGVDDGYPKKMAATSSYMLRSRVRVRPSARRSGARSMRLSR